jgi:hypothetical protein
MPSRYSKPMLNGAASRPTASSLAGQGDYDRRPVNPTGVHFGLERADVFFNVALLNKRAVHARYA